MAKGPLRRCSPRRCWRKSTASKPDIIRDAKGNKHIQVLEPLDEEYEDDAEVAFPSEE